jgi:hypothetical protein
MPRRRHTRRVEHHQRLVDGEPVRARDDSGGWRMYSREHAAARNLRDQSLYVHPQSAIVKVNHANAIGIESVEGVETFLRLR